MRDTGLNAQQPPSWLVLLCVCVYLAFSLQQVVIGHGFGVNLSLGSMLLRVFVVVSCAWMLWHHGIPPVLRWPAAAIGLCLTAVAVSALASGHRTIALQFAPRYALELLMLWSVLNLSLAFPMFARAAARATLIILWLGLLLSIGVQLDISGAKSLALLFYTQETLDQYLPRSSGLYQHPALFGATAVMSLAMTLQLFSLGLYSGRSAAAALLGCLIALLLCGARNPILGLLVLAGAGLWHLRANRHARQFAVVACLVFIGLITFTLHSRYAQLTSASNESFFTAFSLGRPYIWAAAWKAWLSEPLFGLGPSVFQFVIPDFADGRFLRGELHAHNVLLGLLSEMGLFGTLSFMALAFALWQPWLARGTPGRGWAAVVLLTLLSFGLFDYYQPFYGFALYGALMVGLLYASFVPSPARPARPPSRLLRIFKHTLAFGLDKRGFPFMVLGSGTPMGRVRAAARRGLFAQHPRWQRLILRIAMTLAWPIGVLREARRQLVERPVSGKWAPLRQAWQMWSMAMLYNVPPLEFNLYRLDDKARRSRAGDYLYWPEVDLLRTLAVRRKVRIADVQDKARFADICRQHALPCIETLAVFQQGRQTAPAQAFVPVEPGLWVKDLCGSQGSGAQAWQRDDTGYRDCHGQFLQPTEWPEDCRQRDCLIQPWLRSHPDLDPLSLGPLVTLHIVTGNTPTGEVQIIAHLLLLFDDGRHGRPRPILCALDENGQVTRSVTAAGEPVTVHPLTERALVGVTVPHWQDCIELVRRAHAQAFAGFAFLGWDVGVTPQGPLLIESNVGWGPLYHQVLDDHGIGQRAFTDIALHTLETA